MEETQQINKNVSQETRQRDKQLLNFVTLAQRVKRLPYNNLGGYQMNTTIRKPSVEKPWLNLFPEALRNLDIPEMTLREFLERQIPEDSDRIALDYYGRTMSWKEFWAEVDKTACALRALGVKEGTKFASFLSAVPEHLFLLLAAEKIGAMIVCRDDEPDMLSVAIQQCDAPFIFAHDFLSKEDEELFLAETPMQFAVLCSPLTYAAEDGVPEFSQMQLDERYGDELASNPRNLTWEEFLKNGETCTDTSYVERNIDRPLYAAYTSGSTGTSKLVIHSAENIVGVAYQTAIATPSKDEQDSWLLATLPPALVAATVSMMILPLSTGMRLILDPFCDVMDLDLAMMHYQPNYQAFIPMILDVLANSERIPEDYDLSFVRLVGAGCEPMNRRKVEEVESFFHEHNAPHVHITSGYGMSEGGSNMALPIPGLPIYEGFVGLPMPASVISVFDADCNELTYGEIGEICKTGPGNMLGYQTEELTRTALKEHNDGQTWLHTSDYGFMTEQGILCVLGRGLPQAWNNGKGGNLFMMRMENRIIDVPGVADGFFCFVPDPDHEGYFAPYLYIIPEDGMTVDNLEEDIRAVLEEHEQPVEIYGLDSRPYFHFKTNRRGLTADILSRIARH